MNPAWLRDYPAITAIFMDYGWFVPPFLVGYEFVEVRKVADFIAAHPPGDEADRRAIEDRIYRALCEPSFSVAYRARATWFGNRLRHWQDFNHLYESAILSYYKHDYAQSVLCLLTALEGILLSFYGFDFSASERKPGIRQLIDKVRNNPYRSLGGPDGAAYAMYRDTLVKFLEDWIYKDTDRSDFTLSVLNRHYILHGMDHGNFYRPHDLHRLILAFDLLVEYFCLDQRVFQTFLPNVGDDEFLDKRRDHYEALAAGEMSVETARTAERALLRDHRSYVAPSHDPSLEESVKFSMATMTDLMTKFGGPPADIKNR
jgi:hypothetical protein